MNLQKAQLAKNNIDWQYQDNQAENNLDWQHQDKLEQLYSDLR